MPIVGTGWEILIVRKSVQERIITDKNGVKRRYRRTIGTYKVYHDGTQVPGLAGTTAEARGPGENTKKDNGKRIEAGRYPLSTSDGPNYMTLNFAAGVAYPRPGIELRNTNKRTDILIHPGHGFLASVGCINPCKALPKSSDNIDVAESHARVVALIDDLKAFLGSKFPKVNGKSIPNAFVVVEGEP